MNNRFVRATRRVAPAIILILLGLIAYLPSFHAEFQFDDKDFIVNNPAIREIADFPEVGLFEKNASRFIPFVSFALNYHFHKLDVFGYHLVNFIIHIINAFLVWWLAALLLDASSRRVGAQRAVPLRDNKNTIAYFAALVFLLHPVQTETVTYIVQRFASMATMFYLLALCLFIKARTNIRQAAPAYIVSAVCAVAAMFSKQIAFTLPLMILMVDFFFFPEQAKRFWRKPYVWLIAAAFLLLIPFLYDFNVSGVLARSYPSRSHQGDTLTWLTYFLTQSRVLVRYIYLLFIPVGLNFDYDFPHSTTLFDGPTFLSFLALGFLIALAVKLYSKHRLISFCIGWFFITLVVESSIIVLPHVIYEHRLYLPMVGFAILLATLVKPAVGKNGLKPFPARIFIACAIITVYAAVTYQRNLVWQDGLSLWSDVIEKSPQKSRGYHNRGFHYLQRGEYEKALQDFNKAIELSPKYLQAYSNRATTHRALGHFNKAMADYNKAIELKPNNAQAYHNRGQLYAAASRTEKALADYNQALTIAPDYFLVYHNRGRLYNQLGKYNQAIADLSRSIELHPDFPFSYFERGKSYLYKKMNEKAVQDFSRAIELRPKDVKSYNNRAIVYARMQLYDKAIADLNTVIRLDPENGAAYFNRSLIFLAKKDFERALSDAKKAGELNFPEMEEYLEKLRSLVAENKK